MQGNGEKGNLPFPAVPPVVSLDRVAAGDRAAAFDAPAACSELMAPFRGLGATLALASLLRSAGASEDAPKIEGEGLAVTENAPPLNLGAPGELDRREQVDGGDGSGTERSAGVGRGGTGGDSNGYDSGDDWMLRWADEEGKPLNEYFSERSTTGKKAVHVALNRAPPRGILVGPPPGPQTIDWAALANMWDYDNDPWTPTQHSLVGPLSTFQELKKAIPPKLLYSVVILALLVSALIGPVSAAKNAQIASKRREVAQTKMEVSRTEEEVAALRLGNAEGRLENAVLAATVVAEKECLESLSALRSTLYPAPEVTEAGEVAGERTRKMVLTPEWGVFAYPTEVRLRMLKEWGTSPGFLRLEVGRLLRTLEKQQVALDARAELLPDLIKTKMPSCTMPITDMIEGGRELLEAARSTFAALSTKTSQEYSSYTMKRARHLLAYGLLLQRQQELRRDIARFEKEIQSHELSKQETEIWLHKKRKDTEKIVSRFIRVAEDVKDAQLENTLTCEEVVSTLERYFDTFGLTSLYSFLDSLHGLEGHITVEKLKNPILRLLRSLLDVMEQNGEHEAKLLIKLGELQALGTLEEKQAADSMSAACETFGAERDRMLSEISMVLGDVSEVAVAHARHEEQIRHNADAIANAKEALHALQPLLQSEGRGAIQGIV
ncbi:hypothetical protein Efla_007103 [Eimeria flavescens]